MRRILICPQAWAAVSQNQRRCLFRRFPYAVLYLAKTEELLVTAVIDIRADPSRRQDQIEKTG